MVNYILVNDILVNYILVNDVLVNDFWLKGLSRIARLLSYH